VYEPSTGEPVATQPYRGRDIIIGVSSWVVGAIMTRGAPSLRKLSGGRCGVDETPRQHVILCGIALTYNGHALCLFAPERMPC
jgi:hypothetical protein